MLVDGVAYRTIWPDPDDAAAVCIIDQRYLPHRFKVRRLRRFTDGVRAIRDMQVRGAPLIGATAAWSLYLAAVQAAETGRNADWLRAAGAALLEARPTAANLRWAVRRLLAVVTLPAEAGERVRLAAQEAALICDEDVAVNRAIGTHGLALIEQSAARRDGGPVQILTHCNAGWLATVDIGTATAPIYLAMEKGIDLHVWVDETRPRNQGAALTAWELGQQGVPHTVIVDNAGGHLMQRGQVDLLLTGTDRVSRNGDVANKIGTYLKALAARDNGLPFYVGVPSSSIDWDTADGLADIPIEQRAAREVTHVSGQDAAGQRCEVLVTPQASAAANPAFDVTPARLVTGLITERGIASASENGLTALFPEHAAAVRG